MSILYYSFPGRPFFLTKSIADNNSRAEHAQELPTTRLATTIEVVYRAVIDRAIPKKREEEDSNLPFFGPWKRASTTFKVPSANCYLYAFEPISQTSSFYKRSQSFLVMIDGNKTDGS